MTPSQIDQLRTLYSNKKQATATYHHALQTNASDSIRHAAELACEAAHDAIVEFQANL